MTFLAPSTALHSATSLALFCKVVDNYGDIGICSRLARQLVREHGLAVTLWVDDLASFRRLCPAVDPGAALQQVEGVLVRHWSGQEGAFTPDQVADIVIEFFACDIPPRYIEAMAARAPKPVWLNLEGLTAEEWVEGCHTLPSMHPRLALTKHFFFPGFSAKTGGLLREAQLDTERCAFQADRAGMAAHLARFGVTDGEMATQKVSLFCYPHAPVSELFDAWQYGEHSVTCLVPEGVAPAAVAAFLGTAPAALACARRGRLTVRVLPFVPQPDYDRLLWACDVNFVRGEDSWVRAQWAGRPFVWHIYPQDENLHHKKLRAFLARYASALPELAALALRWNGAHDPGQTGPADWPALWRAFDGARPAMTAQAAAWEGAMRAHGDLAGKLLDFAALLRKR